VALHSFKVFSNKLVHDTYGPLMIRNNTARYNYGPGLWSDGGGWNISYIGNTLTDNALAGIHHEISFHATISGNHVAGNCWRYNSNHSGGVGWEGYCGQITLSTSENVTIEKNEIVVDPLKAGSYLAVSMYQDARGTDRHTNLTYMMHNNVVRNNTIHFRNGGKHHIRTGVVGFNMQSEWGSANISFDKNMYTVDVADAADPAVFWWCDGTPAHGQTFAPCKGLSFAEFQSKGQELHGTWAPRTTTPVPSFSSDTPGGGRDYAAPVRAKRSMVAVCSDAASWGAKGDGVTNDTICLQAAIDACSQQRERVVLTKGSEGSVFLITPLVLRSNLHLTVSAGVTLKASNNMEEWPRHSGSSKWLDILSGDAISNCTLDGGGMIDGQGQVWWDMALAELKNHTATDGLRPRMVTCHACDGFALRGLRLLNSPCFHVFLSGSICEVTEISIQSPPGAHDSPLGWLAPNTDGIDIACKGGYIARNRVINGDDSLCVKSPGSDLLFEDNYVEQGNGIVIGTSNASDISNVTFRSTFANRTAYGAHIKFKKDQVGHVHGVVFENLSVIEPYRYVLGIDQNNQGVSADLSGMQEPTLARRPRANVSIYDITYRNIRTLGQVKTAGLFICDKKMSGGENGPKGASNYLITLRR
jgi:hypothetical protein